MGFKSWYMCPWQLITFVCVAAIWIMFHMVHLFNYVLSLFSNLALIPDLELINSFYSCSFYFQILHCRDSEVHELVHVPLKVLFVLS